MSHTPGPWTHALGGFTIRAPSNRHSFQLIASLSTGMKTRSEVEANTRLIAAAPDLLAELKSARQTIETLRCVLHYGNEKSTGNQVCIKQLEKIDSLISRATGKTITQEQ